MAVKPQLACFERLGAPGWAALERVVEAAHSQGLLVVADGKRGDVPVSASAYAQALFGSTPSPFGDVRGLGADAATLNGTARPRFARSADRRRDGGRRGAVRPRSDIQSRRIRPSRPALAGCAVPRAPGGHGRRARPGADGPVRALGAWSRRRSDRAGSHRPAARADAGLAVSSCPASARREAARRTSGPPSEAILHRRSSRRRVRSREPTTHAKRRKPFGERFGKWLAGLSTPARRTMNHGYDRDEPGGLEFDGNHPIFIHARPTLDLRADRRSCSRLIACGVAIYLVVMSFTENDGGGDSKNDKKGRSEQSKDDKQANANSYTVAAGDTLSAIAIQTGIPEPRIERLNPDLDSETLNAGQILVSSLTGLLAVLLAIFAALWPRFPPRRPAAHRSHPRRFPRRAGSSSTPNRAMSWLRTTPKTAYPIASATKLMTYLAAAEQLRPGREIVAAPYDPQPGESLAGFEPGDTVTSRDAALRPLARLRQRRRFDAGDRRLGLGIRLRRADERTAADLGLDDTAYTDPIGLDGRQRFERARPGRPRRPSSASSRSFARSWTPSSITLRSPAEPIRDRNRNALVLSEPFIDGIKTGTTLAAGYVLVALRNQEERRARLGRPGRAGRGSRDAATLSLWITGSRSTTSGALVKRGRAAGRASARQGRTTSRSCARTNLRSPGRASR